MIMTTLGIQMVISTLENGKLKKKEETEMIEASVSKKLKAEHSELEKVTTERQLLEAKCQALREERDKLEERNVQQRIAQWQSVCALQAETKKKQMYLDYLKVNVKRLENEIKKKAEVASKIDTVLCADTQNVQKVTFELEC